MTYKTGFESLYIEFIKDLHKVYSKNGWNKCCQNNDAITSHLCKIRFIYFSSPNLKLNAK